MKACHKCGEAWIRREQPGFKESCPKCASHLHACVNCRLYNPSADRCSSITAECTGDREGLNYCDEFQFRDVPSNTNLRNGNGRAHPVSGPEGADERPASGGAGPDARRKFDELFGD